MRNDKLYLVKIGGHVINYEAALAGFLNDFAMLEGPKILVHGGGCLLDSLAQKLNVKQEVVDGRRVTGPETMKLAVMTYAGTINRNIVAQLQARGQNALGLTGADLNSVRSVKRKKAERDFGLVGDVLADGVNTGMLSLLIENQVTPVFCAITHDGAGQLLNTNADSLAAELAKALSNMYEVHLHYCFEKQGVLRDVGDENSLIPRMTLQQYETLKNDGAIGGGMIPKLDNAFSAISGGVCRVVIAQAGKLKQTSKGSRHAGTILVA